MKPALVFQIPPNHAAHWAMTEDGKIEVEMLRFLTLSDAKLRRTFDIRYPGWRG